MGGRGQNHTEQNIGAGGGSTICQISCTTYQQKIDRVRAHRVTDDKDGDPKQDLTIRNSVHKMPDVRVDGGLLVHGVVRDGSVGTLGFVNGPNASIAAMHIRNDANACQ